MNELLLLRERLARQIEILDQALNLLAGRPATMPAAEPPMPPAPPAVAPPNGQAPHPIRRKPGRPRSQAAAAIPAPKLARTCQPSPELISVLQACGSIAGGFSAEHPTLQKLAEKAILRGILARLAKKGELRVVRPGKPHSPAIYQAALASKTAFRKQAEAPAAVPGGIRLPLTMGKASP
jgi:hypothetical protein